MTRIALLARARAAACAAILACTAAAPAMAAEARYPDHPITVVVPFSAGGDADLAARNLAKAVQGILPQPMVVLNKGGANGAIGSMFVREAAPDGYTLLLARVGSQAILPALQADLKYKWDDFTPLGLLDLNPMVCVVNGDSPIRTLRELVDAIRAQPGKLNYSTSGPATVLNLATQILLDAAGLPPQAAAQIVYKGGGEATAAVLSKEVQFSCNNVTALIGNVKAGRLRALVTTTAQRLPELPDVPTAKETGYPQLERISGWSALYGPPGMPAPLVRQWADVLQRLSRDEAWLAGVQNIGSVPKVMAPAETARFAQEQYQLFRDLGKKLDIQIK
ncbi:tripartite tricarboxylate transporter substrate binding protein [Bordetella bronchialis]|uniref:ABC transporter substrate-binding protein n=1 Tax=Bordetella bronchialis TaxID=463025 RepID=A0A193FET7_9BORD|nr:tripartite tricarboxylate transporter substrate binding protein [Bordetella bronchialis]ANN66135.1 ABC transporter substrate-binding protein [Bordetella bronchialis]ANN71216.1 ABC transporter substrate-binding protein [Bordetella bronchialis]